MRMQDNYDVGIYCRLSRDDSNGTLESMSIANQRQMLVDFVEEKGWRLRESYIDVYNLKMIPFDTINAVQTPKITAFGGKTPVESRYFNFRKLFCLTAGFINAPSK